MANLNKTPFPIIDISPYLVSTASSKYSPDQLKVSQKIDYACRHYGFFYLTGFLNTESMEAGVDNTEEKFLTRGDMEGILKAGKDFFGLPEEEKIKLGIGRKDGGDGARGYQKLGENVTQYQRDYHEGYDLYAHSPYSPDVPAPSAPSCTLPPLSGTNPFPSTAVLPNFKHEVEGWIEKMKWLGLKVVEATAVGLGMEGSEIEELKSLVSDPFWVFRMIGYPSLPSPTEGGDEYGISCGAHKDYGCYTLLHADSTQGALQVWAPIEVSGAGSGDDGKEYGWVNADPIQDCFVVNIGEMWEIWTNGLYRSTLHRVVHKSQSFRISVPFFFEPNFTSLVRPLPSVLRCHRNNILRFQLQNAKDSQKGDELVNGNEVTNEIELKKEVVYGQFLLGKVMGNFTDEASGGT